RGVHGDSVAPVLAGAAQVGRVNQPTAGRIELGHKGIYATTTIGSLKGAGGGGKVGRRRIPGDVDVAGGVERDAQGPLTAAAAQVGRVNQPAAGRIELGHKGLGEVGCGACVGGLEGAARGGEVRRIGTARDIGVAG